MVQKPWLDNRVLHIIENELRNQNYQAMKNIRLFGTPSGVRKSKSKTA